MNVYLSLMQSAGAPWTVERLSTLLSAHGFQQADVRVGESVTYVSEQRFEELERFIRTFFRWLDGGTENEVPTWSILVSDRPLSRDQRPHHLPEWALIEFFHSLLLDEEPFQQLSRVDPDFASRFSWNGHLHLHIFRRTTERHAPAATPPGEPVAVPFESFSSRPEAGAQVTTVKVSGFPQLMELARHAYRDVRIDSAPGLGGLNAVVLLSAEGNRLRTGNEPQGAFSLYNLAALGLRYSTDPRSLASLIADKSIEVLHITAEPRDVKDEDRRDGVSRSS